MISKIFLWRAGPVKFSMSILPIPLTEMGKFSFTGKGCELSIGQQLRKSKEINNEHQMIQSTQVDSIQSSCHHDNKSV